MPNNRKRLQGVVVSNKMSKTVAVEIERRKSHRVYEKVLTSTKKILAHDESNEIPLGAVVRIVESRPLSKRKRWVVEEVLVDPGNKVVESISDEQEVIEAEQIGRATEEDVEETEAAEESEVVAEVETDEAEAEADADDADEEDNR
jgi:small subunit ribosomal protein S17